MRCSPREERLLKLAGRSRKLLAFLRLHRHELFNAAFESDLESMYRDTGPGVPPEDRLKILEPYFTTKAGGTGLGLAIASRICQEHGGALEVDGAPGQGALFRVVLPLDAGSPKS